MATTPSGTYVIGSGASVTDAQGNVYAINAAGLITINGKVDTTTARVDGLAYANGLVWQKNADNLWYSKTSPTAAWVDFPAVDGVPVLVPTSANDTTIKPSGTGSANNPFYDGYGNAWSINLAGQVVVDGQVDTTTARVVQMDLVNGQIWHENADGFWYSKVKPSDTWTPAVTIDPIVAARATSEAWVGGKSGNNPTIGSNWSKGVRPTPHQSLTMSSGTMNLGSGNLAGDTLTIAQTGNSEASAPTINMTGGGRLSLGFAASASNAVKVNVNGGQVVLDLANPYPSNADVIVTADKLSSVLLSANMVFGKLTQNGGTVVLNGDANFNGTAVMLTGNLAGTGTAHLNQVQSVTSRMEVTGVVGAGVTLEAAASVARGSASSIVLDTPTSVKGHIQLTDSYLELKFNLGTVVDSVSYKDSMLSLFSGSKMVASVDVVGFKDTAAGGSNGVLSFGKSAAGDVYAYNCAPGLLGSGGITILPTHA